MRLTRPPVLGEDTVALDSMWAALSPESTTDTPVIRAVMITSLNGVSSVDGRSAGLGTTTDHLLFHAMRARADLILVGAQTALTEGYGPAQITPAWQGRRTGPPPQILLLSRGLSDRVINHCVNAGGGLDIVAAHDADPERVRVARERGVRVHVLSPLPIGEAVRELAAGMGAREISFEGGPGVLTTFLEAGGVDELILSLSPQVLISGDSSGLVTADSDSPCQVPMRVVAAFSGPDGGLYTRWTVGETTR